jgi:predicted enzyme related to lactoylglutathione lyase
MLELSEPLNLWLSVRDLERAKEFYGRRLGLHLWREEPKESLHFDAGAFVLSVHAAKDGELPPRGSRIVFTVGSNIDGLCDELARRGVVFARPLADLALGRAAMFLDPDGHELWVCRPSATETQFERWKQRQRSRERRIPVQRRRQVRRHEPKPLSRRDPHPQG